MANTILTLDIGVSKATLAEFSCKKGAVPALTRYATRALDSLGPDVATRTMESLSGLVGELGAEMGVKGGKVTVLLPSTAVFPRPVKIPRLQGDKLDEMVREEAQQNLPFHIDEVVWDYQVIGETADGDLDTLIFATKNENADDAAACAEGAGFRLSFVDAAPLALYNCASYNYPGIDNECAMILDIGARATTLVILDGGKIFVRGINVGGNVITNEIARGLSVTAEEAESAKKEIGFVALGGTYAADDETADKVSKIIRNVVTRLHSEVARSINFYRVQQGGAAPAKLYITGGTSLTQNIGSFFQEKLQIEVEYLNPFARVGLAPGYDNQAELLLLAPSVGLAVRAAGAARMKIDLTPPAVLDAQRFARRLPVFGVSVLFVILAMGCWVMFANKNQEIYAEQQKKAQVALDSVTREDRDLTAAIDEVKAVRTKVDYLEAALRARPGYLQMWNLVDKAMIPDTWVTRFQFMDEGTERFLNLTVLGFKNEFDKLRGTSGSPGENLLARIRAADKLETADEADAADAADGVRRDGVTVPAASAREDARTPYKGIFFDYDPAKTKVLSEPDVGEGRRLKEIQLRLKLAERPGEINKDGKLPTDWIAK